MNEHNLFLLPLRLPHKRAASTIESGGTLLRQALHSRPSWSNWVTIGADYIARDAITLLKDAGTLKIVTPASVLAKYEDAISESICYSKVKP